MEKEIKQLLAKALYECFHVEREYSEVILERPADTSHGDWATNLALTLARELQMNPRQIAELLVQNLRNSEKEVSEIESIEVAGPGFINFTLNKVFYLNAVKKIDASFGKHNLGHGRQVMVEFGQPNTHKAFHVGHLKSAISGLAMVRLLENLGYSVVQANFYGDVGMHVAKCTWGALQTDYQQMNLAQMEPHERMKVIDEFYVKGAAAFKESEQAEAEIRAINKNVYSGEQTEAYAAYLQLRDWSLEHLDDLFGQLGISYDRQYPESELFAEAVEIVKKHIPEIFIESEGAIIFPGEKMGLNNWVFLTSEGLPTYEAKDLALAYKKFAEYDLDHSIITTSVEQTARFKAIINALERIDDKFVGRYKHIPFGWLLRGGKKQSSRMGGSVKGIDVINEAKAHAANLISTKKEYGEAERNQIVEAVAQAGLKFLVLSHEFHKDINYDPDNFITLEGFSGPYVMYAYARVQALLRDANQTDLAASDEQLVLESAIEMSLIRKLVQFPEITKVAGERIYPHLIANYVYELASEFNQFYAELPILKEEDLQTRRSRLLLVDKIGQVLKSGLGLLGINVVERM